MPIDRDATLKQAEKLLRQGKLEGAIAEYVRLVQDQPRDWNSINALGDLYVRAGQIERAVAQFTQIADFMFAEGFVPKAAALYKKALKVKPDHEHTLLRLSETAARQGLLLDARNYLRQLGRLRRERGDARGAEEILVRLAMLDEADADARFAGARAAQTLGDTPRAVELFKAAAQALAKDGRQREAFDALAEAATLAPDDPELRRQMVRDAVSAGELARAQTLLTAESAGADPELLLALGRMELASGREAEARTALTRMVALAPDRIPVLRDLAGQFARSGEIAAAFVCAEVLVDDALLAGDWDRAFDSLQQIVANGPHIPSLVKLVELSVDAGREDVMETAQAQLADAYLDAGRADEARVIAEDLVARLPASEAHADRLRRVLAVLGFDDAEAIINRYREPVDDLADAFDLETEPLDRDDDVRIGSSNRAGTSLHGESATADADEPHGRLEREPSEGGSPAPVTPAAAGEDAGSQHEEDGAIVLEMLEIDLSDTLAGLGGPAAPPSPPVERSAPVPADLESVFEEMRTRASRQQPGGDGSEEYQRGLQQLAEGRIAEAGSSLRSAARMPQYRFRASARLGRLYLERGEDAEGIEWLERAAEAPPPSPEEGWAVLYDLAGGLERSGESARALAVLLEIEADAGHYRDVRQRVEVLSRAQAGRR
jgi:tetratricopeptide (TPR) repeat protein